MLKELIENEFERALAYMKGAQSNIITPFEFCEHIHDERVYNVYKHVNKELNSIIKNIEELKNNCKRIHVILAYCNVGIT